MATTDFRSRLLSLKNITEDLKTSTTNPSIDLAHIRTLITDLKELSDPPRSSPSLRSPAKNYREESEELSSDYFTVQKPSASQNRKADHLF